MVILNSLEDLDSLEVTPNNKIMVINPTYVYNRQNKTKYTIVSSNIISARDKFSGYRYCLYTDGKDFYVRELEQFKEQFSENPTVKEESNVDNSSSEE